MKYKYHILSQLNKFKKKDKLRLHMPGHKNEIGFAKSFSVAPIDVTELSFSDDLSCPAGAIARAQRDIAAIVGAKRAYITTDGSSSGVFAMLYVASKFGRKIIVPRNSHKSVYNACRIFNLEPVIVQGRMKDGVMLPPDNAEIVRALQSDRDIAGLIVTSPDYYGNVAPLAEYARTLKGHGKLLLCDGAHGAHLAFERGRANYCGVYADMWVDGAHKTLSTLTQGAYVCVNEETLVPIAEEALSMLRTTSPSYPVMASVEYGVKYAANHLSRYARAKRAVEKFRHSGRLNCYPAADWTKLSVDFSSLGISPYVIERELEKRGIYAEMNDGRRLMFYLSAAVTQGQLRELQSLLLKLTSRKKFADTYSPRSTVAYARPSCGYLYALRVPSEWVELSRAEGRICACNAGVTPPCIPVAVAGELITADTARTLMNAERTFGIKDGKIKVVL